LDGFVSCFFLFLRRGNSVMKKLAVMTVAAAALLVMVPGEALAWYCYASSPSAYGWGTSSSRRSAVRRALRECAVRTPRHQTCYLRYCR
jgi:hypothetical protein